MNWAILITAWLLYSVYAATVYSTFRDSKWYVPAGLGLALLCNGLWLWLTKLTPRHQDIAFWAIVWDVSLVVAQISVPVLFFGLRLTPIAWGGLAMAIGGLVLMKVGLQ